MGKVLKDAQKKTFERDLKTEEIVAGIIKGVCTNGDKEVLELTKKFDGIEMKSLKVESSVVKAAYEQVEEKTVESIKKAAAQIKFFAEKQLACMQSLETETMVEGVTLGHKLIPVESVGAYVPAGRYPLPSTALMLAIPAKVAGVKRVVACSPAFRGFESIHPAVLVAMDVAGVDEIYCMGGAQAIAAMAYGTDTVAGVDLIAGPGNRFVAEAKRQVFGKVGIDSLAGPSEVLIIADEQANPDYVAIDLLAQSEHDLNARATLVTTSEELAQAVLEKIDQFVGELPTGETAKQSWEDNGIIILVKDIEEAIAIANREAPEHLEVQTKDDEAVCGKLHNYGSLFIGAYTPVAFGDYCSGTNHTLPTMQTAKYSNGVWVGTFIKTSFYQHITKEGCENLSDTCITLAGVEGLMAHQKSVAIRVGK